jgi:hypothetical protein
MDPQHIVYLILGIFATVAAWKLAQRDGLVDKVKAQVQHGWAFGPIIDGENSSEGMPVRPTMQGSGWFFDFPSSGGVDAVEWHDVPSLDGMKSMIIKFSVEGGGFVPAPEKDGREVGPALVGVMIQRNEDWHDPDARWYHSMGKLQAGEFTITVPFDSEIWSNVNGKKDAAKFVKCVGDASKLAIIFGHGSGYSHGVYATQPSRFTFRGITFSR